MLNPTRKVEHLFVHVAPTPGLARLYRTYDRMLSIVEVLRRMLVLRRIATPDVTATEANAKMHPAVAGFHAILANATRRLKIFRMADVLTKGCHEEMVPLKQNGLGGCSPKPFMSN